MDSDTRATTGLRQAPRDDCPSIAATDLPKITAGLRFRAKQGIISKWVYTLVQCCLDYPLL